MKQFLFLLFICPLHATSQTISPTRVSKIKSATVKIVSFENAGTGFFVKDNGTISTCWHVVKSSFEYDLKGERIIGLKKIYAVTSNNDTINLTIQSYLFRNPLDAFTHDYCILMPVDTLKNKTPFLKLGKIEDANEGSNIILSGYPYNSNYQVLAQGIVSTKYKEEKSIRFRNVNYNIKTNYAYLDITMNQGNSGGPIILLGKSEQQDIVIGYADFIVSPHINKLDSLTKSVENGMNMSTQNERGDTLYSEISTFKSLSNIIKTLPVGISGCISAEYITAALRLYQ